MTLWSYLYARLGETDAQCQLLAHEDVRVVRLAERPLELVELRWSEARPVSLLLRRFVGVGGGGGGGGGAGRCRRRGLVTAGTRHGRLQRVTPGGGPGRGPGRRSAGARVPGRRTVGLLLRRCVDAPLLPLLLVVMMMVMVVVVVRRLGTMRRLCGRRRRQTSRRRRGRGQLVGGRGPLVTTVLVLSVVQAAVLRVEQHVTTAGHHTNFGYTTRHETGT